jgi:hypothetical protein
MSPTASGPERAALSRELSEFLVELSIALHKHAMYPGGHPSLEPAAAAVTRRAELLLETRATLSLGVARQQLVIEGVATDPKHPVLRDLAGRLHRHQLGAVSFYHGVGAAEVGTLLKQLALDGERSGQPLGLGPREALEAWAHIRLHPVSFERLELVGEGGAADEGGMRAAQLWVGLARAALADSGSDEPSPATEPDAVARAIDAPPRSAAYDQVIVGYLLQIANELKATGGAEAAALRRRVSRLVAAMRPETVRRLIEMGGDTAQRYQFVLDATHGLSVDAVLEIVRAAAHASGETVSHGLLRMLAKMARHAATGPEASRAQADAALREQVRGLVRGWTLADPNPDAYGRALRGMAGASPGRAGLDSGTHAAEPLRLVQLTLELGRSGLALSRAVSDVVHAGQVGPLAEMLDALPSHHATTHDVWRQLAAPGVVRRVVDEPPDFKTLDRLMPRLDAAAIEPLFDALAASESRTTRRGLLDRLARAPVDISPLLLQGLADDRWYVQRNMLVLLDTLPGLPEGFSPARWATHADARVRREALKLRLKLPEERGAALVAALDDPDAQVAGIALRAAQQGCPDGAVAVLDRRLAARGTAGFPPELRPSAIKALGRARTADAVQLLLRLTDGGRTWLGRPKLPAKTAELVAALTALAAGWGQDPRARAVLLRGARSSDPEIRAASGLRE